MSLIVEIIIVFFSIPILSKVIDLAFDFYWRILKDILIVILRNVIRILKYLGYDK